MSEKPSAALSNRGLAVRAGLLAGVFFLEKIFLNRFVDLERADAALGAGEQFRIAQHFGFRFIVALTAALIIFVLARGRRQAVPDTSAAPPIRVRPVWLAAHLALIACLAWLTSLLFPATPSSIPLWTVVAIWIPFAAAALIFAFAAIAPLPLWLRAAQSLGKIWLYSIAAALAAACAIPSTQGLWLTMTAATFHVVLFILRPILPGLTADPLTRVIGTPRFAVEILDFCSGLEGMSLIFAFTVVWLWYSRREYRFPRALWLIPLGVALMFLLNAVRISVLTLIGNAGYPDVAVYGFHSQAGWIAFNAVAVGIAVWTQRARWWSRAEPLPQGSQSDNPTALYLMPLLAILASGMLSHAFSGRFEWLYPLRLLACLAVLWAYRRRLVSIDWRWSWRGPLVGLGVFILWYAGSHYLASDADMPGELAAAPPMLRLSWICCRVAATVLTVPLSEELAYRGFLMRRLESREFDSLPYEKVRWLALMGSSVIFGAAHGALWPLATAAGLAYGWVVKQRGHLGEAVTAHMTTNLLVVTVALSTNDWTGF